MRGCGSGHVSIVFANVTSTLKPALHANISPDEHMFNAAKHAGFEVLGNEALLGKREATDSVADIQPDDGTTYEFNLDGARDGSNVTKLLDLQKQLAMKYKSSSKAQRKALTVRYHVALSQVLEASTYVQDDEQDNILNPQHFGHNTYSICS